MTANAPCTALRIQQQLCIGHRDVRQSCQRKMCLRCALRERTDKRVQRPEIDTALMIAAAQYGPVDLDARNCGHKAMPRQMDVDIAKREVWPIRITDLHGGADMRRLQRQHGHTRLRPTRRQILFDHQACERQSGQIEAQSGSEQAHARDQNNLQTYRRFRLRCHGSSIVRPSQSHWIRQLPFCGPSIAVTSRTFATMLNDG